MVVSEVSIEPGTAPDYEEVTVEIKEEDSEVTAEENVRAEIKEKVEDAVMENTEACFGGNKSVAEACSCNDKSVAEACKEAEAEKEPEMLTEPSRGVSELGSNNDCKHGCTGRGCSDKDRGCNDNSLNAGYLMKCGILSGAGIGLGIAALCISIAALIRRR